MTLTPDTSHVLLIEDSQGIEVTRLIVHTLNHAVIRRLHELPGLYDIEHRTAEDNLFVLTAKLSPLHDATSLGAAIKMACRVDADLVASGGNIDPILPGEQAAILAMVENQGPGTAKNVAIEITAGEGLTPGEATFSDGDIKYDAEAGVYTIPALRVGQTAVITIPYTVDAGLNEGDEVTVTHAVSADTFDPDPENNVSAISYPVQGAADLSLTVTPDKPTPAAGDEVAFTVKVENGGPDAATNVYVDVLPSANMSFVSAAPAAEFDDMLSGWIIPDPVANGADHSIVLTYKLDDGLAADTPCTLTVTASAKQVDPDGLTTAEATVTVTEEG